MLQVIATPDTVRKIERLSVKHNLNVDKNLSDFWNTLPQCPSTIPGFKFALRPFQQEGVSWLERMGGRGLLADEMGTGKTVQITAYAHKNRKFPMMVVVPNSIKLNWRNEIVAMTGNQYQINVVGIVYGKRESAYRKTIHPNVTYSKDPIPGHDIYLINYDIVAKHVKAIEGLGIEFLVVDESHKIKNYKATRTQAIVRLVTGFETKKVVGRGDVRTRVSRGIESSVFMSGTPLVNRPVELWTTVNTLADWVPPFSKFMGYGINFCGARRGTFGWDFTGSSNLPVLNDLLNRHIMLRRLKMDVLKDLPPKIYSTIPLQFDRKEYDSVAGAFTGKVDWKAGMQTLIQYGGNAPKSDEVIVQIQKLREIAGYAKINAAIEWIKDFVDAGQKLVVFAHNRNVLQKVHTALAADEDVGGDSVVTIMGGVDTDDRDVAVHKFQNDPKVRAILVGITAGGFGLTLTAASAVAFIQLPWTPGDLQQAADRVHRVGQTADSVMVYNLVAEGTIEEEICDMIVEKAQIMDGALDGGRKVNEVDLTL